MKQSRRMSLLEAMVNVTVGYGLAVVIQILTSPIFGLQASLAQNLKLGLIFDRARVRPAESVRGTSLRQRDPEFRHPEEAKRARDRSRALRASTARSRG